MTLGRIINQMGIGPKLTERFAHTYGGPDYGGGGGGVQESHLFYPEPAHSSHVHHHTASSKHHHHHGGGGGGGSHHKSKAAMSALTLLAFLFFLHILQQCLKEHMNSMTTPQVVVMTGGREGERPIAKSAIEPQPSDENTNNDDTKYSSFTKISTTVHTPQHAHGDNKHRTGLVNSRRNAFPGYVSAMDD